MVLRNGWAGLCKGRMPMPEAYRDDALGLRLLNEFQQGFPVCPAPFAVLASRLGVGEGAVLACLERLRRERGFTELMVSHDLGTVTHHATHVILLNRRVVAEGPTRHVLTAENLARVFGLHMGLLDWQALSKNHSESCAPKERAD